MEDIGDEYGIIICGVCGTLTPTQLLETSLLSQTYLCTPCINFANKMLLQPATGRVQCKTGEGCCTVGSRAGARSCGYCWLQLAFLALRAREPQTWEQFAHLFPLAGSLDIQLTPAKLNLDR